MKKNECLTPRSSTIASQAFAKFKAKTIRPPHAEKRKREKKCLCRIWMSDW